MYLKTILETKKAEPMVERWGRGDRIVPLS